MERRRDGRERFCQRRADVVSQRPLSLYLRQPPLRARQGADPRRPAGLRYPADERTVSRGAAAVGFALRRGRCQCPSGEIRGAFPPPRGGPCSGHGGDSRRLATAGQNPTTPPPPPPTETAGPPPPPPPRGPPPRPFFLPEVFADGARTAGLSPGRI